MSTGFGIFIVFWCLFMFSMFAIGGYFMFRKFLKRLPKEDGMSILDWQDHYINETRHLWSEDQIAFLDELVAPVPELFRDIAKAKIAGTIGEIALKEKARNMTQDLIVRGYIIATPKRDHKWLIKTLKKKQVDLAPYQSLLG